jgi:hypothetical protein
MTPEEKEKIDYEIKAKIKARNEEVEQWAKAGLLAIFFLFFLFILLTIIITIINN